MKRSIKKLKGIINFLIEFGIVDVSLDKNLIVIPTNSLDKEDKDCLILLLIVKYQIKVEKEFIKISF